MTTTDATPETHIDLQEVTEPNPASLQITARLVRPHGTRELTVKYGPDMDLLPDDAEVLAMAERLADQVWGEKSNTGRPPRDRRGDRPGQRRGPFLPPALH